MKEDTGKSGQGEPLPPSLLPLPVPALFLCLIVSPSRRCASTSLTSAKPYCTGQGW
jgi:hypothetical protein